MNSGLSLDPSISGQYWRLWVFLGAAGLGDCYYCCAARLRGWWWISLDPSVVSVNDALNDYRARASTTMAGPTDAGLSARHAVIPEGVYTYITNGREALDGPLTESHIYPAESAITITASKCGFDWRWDVFERRSDTNIWCWINDDLTESQSTTDHIFLKFTTRELSSANQLRWSCLLPPQRLQ